MGCSKIRCFNILSCFVWFRDKIRTNFRPLLSTGFFVYLCYISYDPDYPPHLLLISPVPFMKTLSIIILPRQNVSHQTLPEGLLHFFRSFVETPIDSLSKGRSFVSYKFSSSPNQTSFIPLLYSHRLRFSPLLSRPITYVGLFTSPSPNKSLRTFGVISRTENELTRFFRTFSKLVSSLYLGCRILPVTEDKLLNIPLINPTITLLGQLYPMIEQNRVQLSFF